MTAKSRANLTSVKRSALRHPAVVAVGAAALAALLGLNVAAFIGGMQAPWLLGAVIVADMLVPAPGTPPPQP